MLARRVVPLDHRILLPAPEIDPETAANLVLRLDALCHEDLIDVEEFTRCRRTPAALGTAFMPSEAKGL
jgi:hypothetical protein